MTTLMASAQSKFYVCEKFDSDDFQIADKEFLFNEDRTQVTIGNTTYDVADIDSIVFEKPSFPCVKILWDGSTNNATVTVDPSIKGVTYTTNGGHVTITSTNTTSEILYVLSGVSTNGSLTLNGDYKLTMHLDSLTLTSTKGAAIDIECGKRIELKLIKNTVNTLTDCSNGSQKAALYTKGHLEIKGKGTLNVTGNTKHAIAAKEYLQLKSSLGTLNILGAPSDGLHCGRGSMLAANAEDCRFIMNGGTVNIANCGSDCVDADDYGSMYINGGTLNMEISQEDGNGLKCDSCLYMNGGDIQFNVIGISSNAIRTCYEGYYNGGTITGTVASNGSKGIRGRADSSNATVYNKDRSGNLFFNGTDVNLTVSGGTNVATASSCWGIRSDKNLYQTAGDITVTVTNTQATGISVKGANEKTGGTQTVN